MVTTADQREIDNFAALSDQWWDMRGPMAPLHAFTPIRLDYILANVERFWPKKARSVAASDFEGLFFHWRSLGARRGTARHGKLIRHSGISLWTPTLSMSEPNGFEAFR